MRDEVSLGDKGKLRRGGENQEEKGVKGIKEKLRG